MLPIIFLVDMGIYNIMEKRLEIIQYVDLCIETGKKIKNDFPDLKIIMVAIARGGLVPAIIISDYLKINFLTLGVKSYTENNEQGKFQVYQPLPSTIYQDDCKIILIDDLVDSGNTLKYVYDYLQKDCNIKSEIFSYVLIDKGLSHKIKDMPKYNFIEKIENCWIKFPYDME